MSRTVTFSGVISQTSGSGQLQACTRMKICNKCVNRIFPSALKVLVGKEKFVELNKMAILLTLLEPNQPRAFSARLQANSLQRNISSKSIFVHV